MKAAASLLFGKDLPLPTAEAAVLDSDACESFLSLFAKRYGEADKCLFNYNFAYL